MDVEVRRRLPNRAGLLEPLGRRDHRGESLGHPVVLPHGVGREEFDDPALHVDRARRGGVQHPLHRRKIEFECVLEREDPHEVDRHHVRPRHAFALDQLEALFRVEVAHQHECLAEQQRIARERAGGGVVHGPAREVHLVR